MSPIHPLFGAHFVKAVLRLTTLNGVVELQQALFLAANNRYRSFERRGLIYFGILDKHSNPEWDGKAAVYFCFLERWGSFYFTDARATAYSEDERVAIAAQAGSLSKDGKKRKG